MKKILSVLCVLAFIASFACIGASADDAVSFNLVAAEVTEGVDTFTVDVVAHLPEGGDVTQVGLLLTVPEGIKLDSFKKVYTDEGMYTCSETTDTNPYMILWVAGTASLPVGDTVLCTLTFKADAALAAGAEFALDLEFEPDNMPATVAGDAVTATCGDCTVVVAAATEAPVSTEASEAPVSTEASEAPVSTEASEATEAPATDAPVTEPTDTTGAPATGDNTTMMFAVVALMVVALGAAVVVKKVNVK
ncbi:MAG: LPXTG cell wall anchor domain-containing protein [Ruminococcaceae bacterium]|nr:LPXTG cell wall anchor domain-containing protein [Oscillospiraceae bacterium]